MSTISRHLRYFFTIWLVGMPLLAYAADNQSLAPLNKRPFPLVPFKDDQGRIDYIVSLSKDATDRYPNVRSPGSERFATWQSAKATNMVIDYQARYHFEAHGMASHVGNSFTAYLTVDQVDQLRRDPFVTLVAENGILKGYSSVPPWRDSTYPGTAANETSSWGRMAVMGTALGNATRISRTRVYLIDTGVAHHEDLDDSVITRVNPNLNQHQLVGCYAHSTFIAGIIGATYGNKGVAGVNPGVSMTSLSLGYDYASFLCADTTFGGVNELVTAMDYVYADLTNTYIVAVINISQQDPYFAPGGTLNSLLVTLATQDTGASYPGAFVAQSAGNDGIDACSSSSGAFSYSDRTARPDDGIMVVGAYDRRGLPVTGTSDNRGFNLHNLDFGKDIGSNWGDCVDVWAPGKDILSTFGAAYPYSGPNGTKTVDGPTPYTSYVRGDGTSFSAPYIAGIASYLIEHGLMYSTPGQVEAAIRSRFWNVGKRDAADDLVNMACVDYSCKQRWPSGITQLFGPND